MPEVRCLWRTTVGALAARYISGLKAAEWSMQGLVQRFGFGGYSFDIEKSGILNVRKEDGTLITIPLAGSFSGKFGFQAKATYGYLSEFTLYN